MKKLVPHITFNGDCEAALNFYKDALGGTVEFVQTYKGSPMEEHVPEEHGSKIMHSTFTAGGVHFMAADAMPSHPVPPGSNIDLSIDFDSKEEEIAAFEKMAEGGNVKMPLQDTFWGAHFGMIQDKFGIGWMFNCNLREKE